MHGRRIRSAAAVVALAATGLPGAVQASAAPAPGVPRVKENPAGLGIHGHAWLSPPTTSLQPIFPVVNLAAAGYTEREFVLSGTANEYAQSGTWGSDGRWNVSVAQPAVPYATRIIVRYPSAARFSGNVVVEWLNETNGFEADPVWAETYAQILARGDAYVGVTAQTSGQSAGGAFLKAWDLERYGSLTEPSDAQSYDVYTQAARAVVADAHRILGGLIPARLIAAGDSQSAFRLITYLNAFQPLTHEFAAFLLVGRAVDAAPIGDGTLGLPVPAYIRSDSTTPTLVLDSEDDLQVLQSTFARQPDSPMLRTWEVAGASHVDLHEAAYELALLLRDDRILVPPAACVYGVPFDAAGMAESLPDNLPLYRAEDAALSAVEAWVTSGAPPATATPISTVPILGTILRDGYGNALGGVRLPDIAVPTETFSASNLAPLSALSELGLCLFFGYYTPLSSATLTGLYPTHAAYVTKYTAAARQAEAAGFLTPADEADAVAGAQAAPVP